MKKKVIDYYKEAPEKQKKFLELICDGTEYSDALEQSGLNESCVRDWCYENNEIIDSDIEKCWEEHQCEFDINNEYHISIGFEEAACFDYDPLESDGFYFEVSKIDIGAKEKARKTWIEDQKKKFDGDFDKFAEFVYDNYLEA